VCSSDLILTFYVTPFSNLHPIIFGLTLFAVIILFPNGIVPVVSDFMLDRFSLQPPEGEKNPSREVAADAGHQAGPRRVTSVIHHRAEMNVVNPNEELMQIVGIRKIFGGVLALDDVTLTVKGGHVVGIMGQNGSGKSTLLNIINGFYRPDAGTVQVHGADIVGLPTHEIAKLGIGRSFQIPQLIDGASVVDNIGAGLLHYDRARLVGSLVGLPVVRREERARRVQIEEIMSLLGLPLRMLHDSVDTLPLGLKRIVEVGRAAVGHPRLLLLDEPAAGLNNEERLRLGGVLTTLCEFGITPVVVEHNVEFVMATCEDIVLMESGKVVCEFSSWRDEEIPHALDQYLRFSPAL